MILTLYNHKYNNNTPLDGVNIYTFSLKLSNHHPSGTYYSSTINFHIFDFIELETELEKISENIKNEKNIVFLNNNTSSYHDSEITICN